MSDIMRSLGGNQLPMWSNSHTYEYTDGEGEQAA
jgi:hypothetical protein